MKDQESIPEAISSVTYSLITPNEYPILFTVRSDSGSDLLKTMEKIEETLKAKGFKPQVRQSGGFPKKELRFVEGRVCEKCGEKLVYSTMKDGKEMIKCSTNKWDPIAKKATGCTYVEWPDKPKTVEKKDLEEVPLPEFDPTDSFDKTVPSKDKDEVLKEKSCEECGDVILSDKVISFSLGRWNKKLCYNCQKKQE